MALPSSFQFQDSTENHIAFSRILRSSPTAAIDHYRTLYASRKRWSATDKPYFIAATQIFGATLTYKDWETNVFPDSPAISRGDLLNGFTVGVDSINGDIWKAIVSTELPLLWLDSCLKQNPVHDLVRARFFSTSTCGLNVECRYLRRCSNVSSRLHTYGRKNSVKGPKTIAMAYLPHSLAPSLPSYLRALLSRCWQSAPEDRPNSLECRQVLVSANTKTPPQSSVGDLITPVETVLTSVMGF